MTELCWVDRTLPRTGITFSGVVDNLGLPRRGTASYEHEGNKANLVRCELIMHLYPSITTPSHTAPPSTIRIVVAYDKQSNNNIVPPAYSDVIQDTFFNGTTESIAQSGINLNNQERFIILRDYCFAMPQYSTNLSGSIFYMNQSSPDYKGVIKDTIDLRGLEIWYSGPGAVATDVTRGRILLVTASYWPGQGANDTNANWSYVGKSRILFYN